MNVTARIWKGENALVDIGFCGTDRPIEFRCGNRIVHNAEIRHGFVFVPWEVIRKANMQGEKMTLGTANLEVVD